MSDVPNRPLRQLLDGDMLYGDGSYPYPAQLPLEPSYGPRSAEMKERVESFAQYLLATRGKASIAAAARYLQREAMAGRMAYKLPPPRLFASWAETADYRVRRRKPARRYNW